MPGRKQATPRTKELVTPMERITALAWSLAQCEAELSTAYEKALGGIVQQIKAGKIQVRRAQEKRSLSKNAVDSAQSRWNTKKMPSNKARVARSKEALRGAQKKEKTVQDEQKHLEEQYEQITRAYKKQVGRQKAVQQFEKGWEKQAPKKKPETKRQAKSAKKATAKKTVKKVKKKTAPAVVSAEQGAA